MIGDTPLSCLVAHYNNDENKTGFCSFLKKLAHTNDDTAMLGWLLMCSECFQHVVMCCLKCLVAKWFLRCSRSCYAPAFLKCSKSCCTVASVLLGGF